MIKKGCQSQLLEPCGKEAHDEGRKEGRKERNWTRSYNLIFQRNAFSRAGSSSSQKAYQPCRFAEKLKHHGAYWV
jgi:hypothetical protein